MLTRMTLTLIAATLASGSFAMSDADSNDDKRLSMEEVKTAYPEISEDQFNEADTDQDGALSETELADAIAAGVLPKPGN